jgi:hypothetical protein
MAYSSAEYRRLEEFETLLLQFFSASPQSIGTTEGLAKEMAKLTKVLRNRVKEVHDLVYLS